MLKVGAMLLCGVSVGLLGLGGCETTKDSAGENFVRMAHVVDTDGKQLGPDVQEMLLLDTPTRLSKEPIPLH
jgi:hypothetical protein